RGPTLSIPNHSHLMLLQPTSIKKEPTLLRGQLQRSAVSERFDFHRGKPPRAAFGGAAVT
ncbi:MAG: hypothetical protein ACPGQT_04675, partial [Rhodothermales bacterium]